ncbi:hypothetical protein [Mariniblastus fucicola]|uniref:hypothetical protein n=1 Tax=Mariniblastus fucicola TaxID=980251 RepID=UPI00138FA08B|nr:hypothetical protein [Mariniblastus fucicola]
MNLLLPALTACHCPILLDGEKLTARSQDATKQLEAELRGVDTCTDPIDQLKDLIPAL